MSPRRSRGHRPSGVTCRWGDAFLAVWLGSFLVNAALLMRGHWRAAALTLVAFDFFAFAATGSAVVRRRAAESRAATLLRQQQRQAAAGSSADDR